MGSGKLSNDLATRHEQLERQSKAAAWMKAEYKKLNMSDINAADFLDISKTTFDRWKTGAGDIKDTRLGHLVQLFSPDEERTVEVAKLVRPALEEKWVRQWHKSSDWQYMSYPALSDDWLQAQEPSIQAGLLLGALLEICGVSRQQMLMKLGATGAKYWNGSKPIPAEPAKLDLICKELTPNTADFSGMVMPDRNVLSAFCTTEILEGFRQKLRTLIPISNAHIIAGRTPDAVLPQNSI